MSVIMARLRGHLPNSHIQAWYSYAFGSEVFAACAIAIFLPITLEQMAKEIGYYAPDFIVPCIHGDEDDDRICKARIFGAWIDTASFSMYVKSIAVAITALVIITIGPVANSAFWRKRLLLIFAYTGSLSATLLILFPHSPKYWIPIAAAIITIVGNVSYSTTIVCANAFLPVLAREELEETQTAIIDNVEGDEGDSLLPNPSIPATTDELGKPIKPAESSPLSLTMSRISSIETAVGFVSGLLVLALSAIPLTIGGGSTASLCFTIGLTGIWWGLFTIPAAFGLPGDDGSERVKGGMLEGWKRVYQMIKPSEIKKLPNLFTLLLAWIFLSDGFHTTTYTAIIYASSTLHMSPSKIIIIGVLVQVAAVFSSIYAPHLQKRLGLSNLKLLIWVVVLAQLVPLYACLGLVLPFGGLRTEGEMYVMATWFGLLFGPFNSYSRTVYAELIPPGHESSFFSLFALTDKSASFLGPAVVGFIADRTGNIRLGFLFLLALLAIPVPVLLRVRMGDGVEQAKAWPDGR